MMFLVRGSGLCFGRVLINPFYTGRLFHCFMLDESICHFRGVGSILSLIVELLMENPDSKQCRP